MITVYRALFSDAVQFGPYVPMLPTNAIELDLSQNIKENIICVFSVHDSFWSRDGEPANPFCSHNNQRHSAVSVWRRHF